MLFGCAAKIDDRTTAEKLAAAGKAGVVMEVGLTVDSCDSATVDLGRKRDNGYEQVATVVQAGKAGASKIIRAELEPGEYHVVRWTCQEGRDRTVLGKKEGSLFKQSFGRFEVHAGELVNLGRLAFILVSPGVVHVAASDLSAIERSEFEQEYPLLASLMKTRIIEAPMPDLTPAEKAVHCQRINQIHKTWRLPPHRECMELLSPEAVGDPERPGIWQSP